MAQYKGSVELISGLTQKNGGDFPLMEAHAIQVDATGKRLDEKLAEIGRGLNESEKANLLILLAVAKNTSDEKMKAYNALLSAWGLNTSVSNESET